MKRRTFVRSTMAGAASVVAARPLWALSGLSLQDPPDVDAVTGDGHAITLKGRDLVDLAKRLRGNLLLAEDEGYDEARRILNPSFDKHPAVIVQPTGTADVRAAVDFAREHRLLVAVKCGGHSASGQSTCNRGMQVDLSRFRGVRVDPAARRAWADGGSLLGQIDHETLAYGLVTTLGTVSHTGVGGLTLGGGFGRVARRFGLALDNVLGVDIVTADGQYRRADSTDHRDLFWGVRGGGGNFGIVTSFEFQLHPMDREIVGGDIVFPIAKARDFWTRYADYAFSAPDELYIDPFMSLPAGGEPGVVGFSVCYSGPASEAERVLAPLRKVGTPLADGIKAMDYGALQRAYDTTDPRARSEYVKGGFIAEMPEELIAAILDGFEGHPARGTTVYFQHAGGAIGHVAPEATAFPHRYAKANMLVFVSWKYGDDPAAHIEWIKQYWTTLEPFTHGYYANDQEPGVSAAVASANYRENFDRLVALKNEYDPTNLFRLNANVRPTA